jgi:hypothetical protein
MIKKQRKKINREEAYKKWSEKKNWRKKEKKDARDFLGRTTPRSGGMWNKPGDVSTLKFLFDCKYTDKDSYSVKSATLKKIYKEAILSNKLPALSVQLKDGTEFVAIRKDDFMEILNFLTN